jgi:hypothetical protein
MANHSISGAPQPIVQTGDRPVTYTLKGKPQPGDTNKKGEYTLAADMCNCTADQITTASKKNGYADVMIAKDEFKNAWFTGKKLDFRDAKGRPTIPAVGQQVTIKLTDGNTINGTVLYADKD